jgi:hypothetical protein
MKDVGLVKACRFRSIEKLPRLEGNNNPGKPNGKLRGLEKMTVDSEFPDL